MKGMLLNGDPPTPAVIRRIMSNSQDDEEGFLREYFQDTPCGFLVDVGAADGETGSNTCDLLKNCGWGGLLIEPHPSYYEKVCSLYKGRIDVTVSNKAVWCEECTRPFYIFGGDGMAQVSTVCTEFKERVEREVGDMYDREVDVTCLPLNAILRENECPKVIHLLDIDCEGADLYALKSVDRNEFDVHLICIELSMEKTAVDEVLKDTHRFIKQLGGNGFWEKV